MPHSISMSIAPREKTWRRGQVVVGLVDLWAEGPPSPPIILLQPSRICLRQIPGPPTRPRGFWCRKGPSAAGIASQGLESKSEPGGGGPEGSSMLLSFTHC